MNRTPHEYVKISKWNRKANYGAHRHTVYGKVWCGKWLQEWDGALVCRWANEHSDRQGKGNKSQRHSIYLDCKTSNEMAALNYSSIISRGKEHYLRFAAFPSNTYASSWWTTPTIFRNICVPLHSNNSVNMCAMAVKVARCSFCELFNNSITDTQVSCTSFTFRLCTMKWSQIEHLTILPR